MERFDFRNQCARSCNGARLCARSTSRSTWPFREALEHVEHVLAIATCCGWSSTQPRSDCNGARLCAPSTSRSTDLFGEAMEHVDAPWQFQTAAAGLRHSRAPTAAERGCVRRAPAAAWGHIERLWNTLTRLGNSKLLRLVFDTAALHYWLIPRLLRLQRVLIVSEPKVFQRARHVQQDVRAG